MPDDQSGASQGIQVRQRLAQHGPDVAAQQGGVAFVDLADDEVCVAVQDAFGQSVQHILVELFGIVPSFRHTPSVGFHKREDLRPQRRLSDLLSSVTQAGVL